MSINEYRPQRTVTWLTVVYGHDQTGSISLTQVSDDDHRDKTLEPETLWQVPFAVRSVDSLWPIPERHSFIPEENFRDVLPAESYFTSVYFS